MVLALGYCPPNKYEAKGRVFHLPWKKITVGPCLSAGEWNKKCQAMNPREGRSDAGQAMATAKTNFCMSAKYGSPLVLDLNNNGEIELTDLYDDPENTLISMKMGSLNKLPGSSPTMDCWFVTLMIMVKLIM